MLSWMMVGSYPLRAQTTWMPPYQAASAQFEQGRVTEAYEQTQRTLLAVKRSTGIDSPEYAEGLRLLTLIAASTLDYPLALSYARQEVAVYSLLSSPSPQSHGQALQNQGVLYLHLDSLSAARHSLEQAAHLLQQVDSSGYTQLLYQLAKVYHKAGQYSAADSLYRMVTKQAVANRSLLSKAEYYRSLLAPSSLDRTDTMHRQAVKRLQQSGDTLTLAYADAYYRWACSQTVANQWERAEQLYRRTKAIYDATSVVDSAQYASVLNNLGVLALAKDDPREAARWIEEAFRIRRHQYTVADGELWSSVDNLAMAYYENDDDVDALALYEKYLSHTDTTQQHPWQYAIALSNLASIYQDQQQYKRAEIYYERATRHLNKSVLARADQKLHQASVFYNVARNHQKLARSRFCYVLL